MINLILLFNQTKIKLIKVIFGIFYYWLLGSCTIKMSVVQMYRYVDTPTHI